MEYVVPLVIVLVIVIVVIAGARFMGRRGTQTQGRAQDSAQGRSQQHSPGQDTRQGPHSVHDRNRDSVSSAPEAARKRSRNEITREDAQEASARLSPEAHRRVYALIAQHQVLNAVKEYRKATKTGLGDAAAAVAALAQFPQPRPEPATPAQFPQHEPTTQTAPSIKEGPLTVDDIISATPSVATPATPAVAATGSYRYRAIVSQGNEVREVASTRLNAEIYGQIRQLALSGNHDEAVRLLRDHSDVGEAQALEFVSMIGPDE